MPELPEVETLRLGLQKYIVGSLITNVEVKLKRIFSGEIDNIIGSKIINVRRFGKGLVIDLDNNYSIAIHVKMTGQLIYRNQELVLQSRTQANKQEGRIEVPNQFTHIVFKLKNMCHPELVSGSSQQKKKMLNQVQHDNIESYLFYNDIRQFGWIKIVKTEDIKEMLFFKELGPEPLIMTPVKGQVYLSLEKFKDILNKSKTPIKVVIMDQKKIAGIGNIYANDGLYLAKINPKKPSNALTSIEQEKLYESILIVLKKGLLEGGASEFTFVNVLGEKGNYQNHTLIYGKEKQNCKICGTKIEKFVLGGRGTFWCKECQK